MLTNISVLESATLEEAEVLVVFDNDGKPLNHLLRNAPDLCARLTATPRTLTVADPTNDNPDQTKEVPNPARAIVEADAFTAARQEMDAIAQSLAPQPDVVVEEPATPTDPPIVEDHAEVVDAIPHTQP